MGFSDFAASNHKVTTQVLSARGRRMRLIGVAALCAVWGALVVTRLVSIQITDVQQWHDWALKQHLTEVKLSPERGPIYDRHGRLLAVSVPSGSVYVRPAQVKRADREKMVADLAAKLGIKAAALQADLDKGKPFVWAKRQVPRALAQEIAALGYSGVGYLIESKRYYPFNEAASTLIGKTGIDGNGLSGLEARFDQYLKGRQVSSVARRDALGKLIHADNSDDGLDLPRGEALALTIDAAIQMVMDEELERGVREAKAKHVMAVMVDSENGEVLALGQSAAPNFNLSHSIKSSDLHNLVAETVFEPGSIFKPFIVAAALEAGITRESEILDCGNGRLSIGRHNIKDVHSYDRLSLRDVVVRSSNIGMSRLGMRFGKDRLYEAIRSFGFGSSSGLGFPGETAGILRRPDSWAAVDEATHSFGQGIAVTPLQIARAVAAIANGGKLLPLQLIKEAAADRQPIQIISQRNAGITAAMMQAVVEDPRGTGQRASIPGLVVGGKTGTAQKARRGGRGYEPGAYMASFVGFVDGHSSGVPRNLTLVVVVDEPRTKVTYGGVVAAPIFQKIMQRTFAILATEEQLRNPRSLSTGLNFARTDPDGWQINGARYRQVNF